MKKNIQILPVAVNKTEPVSMNMTIGERIKMTRKMRGLSQRKVALLLDVKQQTLSDLEIGKSKHTSKLKEIAHLLGVSQSYLLGETELESNLTPDGQISYNFFVPILEEHDIMPWLYKNVLPTNCRRLPMATLQNDNSINTFSYFKNITHDEFVDNFFKFKLPHKELFAIVNPLAKPAIYDLVDAKLPDGGIKIRQYVKDGDEYFLKSFTTPTEKISIASVVILGVISGYIHKNI